MQESIPEDWKTNNLFVLVGGNPLPNYVAASTLLVEGGRLHLLCSSDTKNIADRLAGFFDGRSIIHEICDPADHIEIRRLVTGVLRAECIPGTVGLHYTGGTKAMSVHSYQTILAKQRSAVFTYLDSKSKTLRKDGSEEPINIQFATKPTVANLFNLHDIELKHPPLTDSPQPLFPELERTLAKVHGEKDGIKAYAKWCAENLRPNGNLLEKGFVLFPTDPYLGEVGDQMRITLGVDDVGFDAATVVKKLNHPKLTKTKHLIKYLDGLWVENWVLSAFIANQESGRLHSIATSLETATRFDFEFDVAAMQGYQLFAVSCTRDSTKDLCKSKLFEAYIRATQMGGDEARVALVCTYDKSIDLATQVAEIHRISSNRMELFGYEDLPCLTDKFAKWLKI